MNHFSDDLRNKDLLMALGLWLVIEAVSFVLFPTIGLIASSARLRTGFLLSVPFGLGGVAFISMSSRVVAMAGEQGKMALLIAQFGGWIGLAGIMFPFLIVCIEFFSTLDLPR